MAALDRSDLLPILCGSKPKVALAPKLPHVARNNFQMKVLLIYRILPLIWMVLIVVLPVHSRMSRRMHWTTEM
jgi:hypothetical protein